MRKRKKILLTICITLAILIIGFFSFIKFGGYFIMDENLKEEFITDIENSSKLPDRFYEIYNVMYPHSMNPNSWTHLLTHNVNEEHTHCACSEAVHAGTYPIHVKTKDRILIINMIEQKFNQKKCLDYYIHKRIKKEKMKINNLFTLSDKEIISLLLQIENSSYYNKERYPERIQNKISSVLKKLHNL